MIESESEVAQSYPTLCYPMDCSLPGSTVHGIFQARILEWVAISFSRRSSWPRDRTWVSCVVGRCFPIWATRDWEITNVDRLHLNVTRSHVSFFLFFTALGPHCFVWAFSGCSKWVSSSQQCTGFSLWWLLLLWSTGSRHMGFSSRSTWAW